MSFIDPRLTYNGGFTRIPETIHSYLRRTVTARLEPAIGCGLGNLSCIAGALLLLAELSRRCDGCARWNGH